MLSSATHWTHGPRHPAVPYGAPRPLSTELPGRAVQLAAPDAQRCECGEAVTYCGGCKS